LIHDRERATDPGKDQRAHAVTDQETPTQQHDQLQRSDDDPNCVLLALHAEAHEHHGVLVIAPPDDPNVAFTSVVDGPGRMSLTR
jgi:hypothetical protein